MKSSIAKLVDRIADANGLDPIHLKTKPHLLEPYGLDPEDITKKLCHEADEIHDKHMRRIRARIEDLYDDGT